MVVTFTSCQHQSMTSIDFTVKSYEWYEDGSLLTYNFIWDALDEDVVRFGTVNAYFIDNGLQNPLPFIYKQPYYDLDENLYYVPENIAFTVKPGCITITIEDLDNNFEFPASTNWGPTMSFRVVAIGD